MGRPLVTLAIPTYNRARRLDQQLAWATSALERFWEVCELMVVDNGSPDETAQVTERWVRETGGRLRSIRRPTNVGLCANVASCWEWASGEYVWVVGDDDPIIPDGLARVLDVLRRTSPGVVHLNHRCVSGVDGSIVHERAYDCARDVCKSPGASVTEQCLRQRDGGVMFVTGNVVRADLARQALRSWPSVKRNFAVPLFVNAVASARSAAYLVAEPICDSVYYVGSWLESSALVEYRDMPAVYARLRRHGYSSELLTGLIAARWNTLRAGHVRRLATLDPAGTAWTLGRLAWSRVRAGPPGRERRR